MRVKRNINVAIAYDYNKLAHFVNNKYVVIYIVGGLYDEMIETIKSSKLSKFGRKFGGVVTTIGVLTGGTLAIILGAANILLGLKDDFKSYNAKINEKDQVIELYLCKGKDKYNEKYDTLVFSKRVEQ